MGLKRPERPRVRPGLIGLAAGVDDPAASRAIAAVEQAVGQLERRAFAPSVLTGVDLSLGVNVIDHGLGRAPLGVVVVPTALGADWRWVQDAPHRDRQVRVELAGVAMPGATVVVF